MASGFRQVLSLGVRYVEIERWLGSERMSTLIEGLHTG